MSDRKMMLPGATLGILGGGQLGRMLAMAARRMGYRVRVLDPAADCPTSHCADEQVVAEYGDVAALAAFARGCDVVTFEFENVPAESLDAVEAVCPVRPSPRTLHATRNRIREKTFLAEQAGAPVGPWRPCRSADDVAAALKDLGGPCILKTAEFGYDGKGQVRLEPGTDAAAAWASLHTEEAILEAVVPFECEVSVLIARNPAGETAVYPISENRHANHILDVTLVPADITPAAATQATDVARRIADAFPLEGLLAVEMFVVRDEADGSQHVLVNELAPRPHNSGHYSFDASVTSQFEQQLRAVGNLPLGDTALTRPAAAMANLLGDLWYPGDAADAVEPQWAAALTDPAVKLHLYGKTDPRPGRKMGHLTALADDPQAAAALVLAARERLGPR